MDKGRPTALAQRAPFGVLLGANAVSMIGDNVTFVAVPWFVLQTTGSVAQTGLTGGVIALAVVLAGFFGGPLVDSLGFKLTSVATDLASGVAVALIPLLYNTVGLAFWQLLVLVFLENLLAASGSTARQSLIPHLAGEATIPMERANAAAQAIQRFAYLVGPPLAGILIPVFGTSNVLWLDAVTFATSAAAIVVAIPVVKRAQSGGDKPAGASYLANLGAGIGFIRRDRLVLSLIVMGVVLNFLVTPFLAVVLPVYARETYHSAANLGLMIAGFGGGSLVGAALYGMVGRRLPRRATIVVSIIIAGFPLWIISTIPALPISIGALFITGVGFGPINPVLFTILQERSPAKMLGRVNGAFTALAMAAVPLGMIAAGYALAIIGLRFTLIGIATCYLIMSLSALMSRSLRAMDMPLQDAALSKSAT